MLTRGGLLKSIVDPVVFGQNERYLIVINSKCGRLK